MFTKCGLWTILASCIFILLFSSWAGVIKDLKGTVCIVKENHFGADCKRHYIVYNDVYGTLELVRNNNDFKVGDKITLGPGCYYSDLFRTTDKVCHVTSIVISLLVIIIILATRLEGPLLENEKGYLYSKR